MNSSRCYLPETHLRELDHLASWYWWHIHRIETVLQLAGRFLPADQKGLRYLDVGCGPGSTTRRIAEGLARRGLLDLRLPDAVVGLDGDPRLREACRNNLVRLELVDLEKDQVNLKGTPYHFFTALDVLEHLDSPRRLLKRLHPCLSEKAIGVVTVPAFQFLYSDWDAGLGHRRRYALPQMNPLFLECGYQVLFGSYLYSFVFPLAYFFRRLRPRRNDNSPDVKFPQVSKGLNVFLKAFCWLERAYLRHGRLPFGTSVIAVVQRG